MISDVQKAWEACDKTDTVFVLCCTVFCWTIIPAVGLGYSGYSTRRSGLASFIPSVLTVCVCSIQWFIWGYALAYGDGPGGVIGDLTYAFHRGVLANPVGTIPALLFSEFQLVFLATVCAISVGGACERGRILPLIPFIFVWATLIYCPLAHMVWGGGFLGELGVLDFAGGTPVHICSGATASALSLYLSYPIARSRTSPNRTPSHLKLHRPHNSMCQVLAMIIIWGSWLAFDAGTTLSLTFQSVMALCVTNLCASAGSVTWALITYYETGKWSLDSIFMGAIAGLVMITPAAGFIDLPTSLLFGVLGAVVCRQALRIKFTDFARKWKWVDNGDTFATHCVGGFLGTICTGLFAQKAVAGYGGAEVAGGVFFDGNIRQLGLQIVEALIGFTWSFVGSYVIIALIDCIPGLEFLAEDKDVNIGMDASQMDESLYEAQWAGEEDYKPLEGGHIALD
ncbi:putative ammonium transporter [Exophiala viscosa]|uniref:putative ammonium transporter n=1 Tax=Exophiala viscosa TaxID=2486360 RepID=UPI00219EA368|nr:putative ammonium transporter [Exophiala viscosa]